MRIIIFILCCVCGIYGKINSTVSVQERNTIIVTFKVSIINENDARCISTKKELYLEEGRTVKLNAYHINIPKELITNQQYSTEDIQKAKCVYKNGSGQHDLGEEYDRRGTNNRSWEEEHTITKDMYGIWSCTLKYNANAKFGDINPIEQVGAERYSYVICNLTVKKPGFTVSTAEGTNLGPSLLTQCILGSSGNLAHLQEHNTTYLYNLSTTPLPPVSGKETLNSQIWYIIVGVGIVVLLIIVGQTIALCYFKRKAQPRRRMDIMTARSRFDRGDRARYSAPPCKKSTSSAIAEADRDSHIYEMVGVNALYNKSSDLEPGGNTDTAERNIRDRPPLPLPHEIPKLPLKKPSPLTSTPSSLSLNSTNSGCSLIRKKGKELPPQPGQGLKKAPARPPKQIDEDSIPGSLRRTAKPAASPATGSASAKTGTLPKATSTESPMSELKNIFKKRNVGNDTPTPSPAATLERKVPPKFEVKTSTLTKTQTQKQPNVSTKPIITQQNQIKLILPKIEASLMAPKPLVPKAVEPTVPPIKSPPPPKKAKKPSKVVSQKQKPVSQKPVIQPAAKSVQKRPLPTPESARKLPPEPTSPHPVPSLPPIYQTADDDSTPGTDDEEWTYEQLGQYNIYNI